MKQLLDLLETIRCHDGAAPMIPPETRMPRRKSNVEFAGEPDAGKLPVAPNRPGRDFEDLHDLLFVQSAEIAKLYDLGLARRDLRERGKRVVERDHGTIGLGGEDGGFVEVHLYGPDPAFVGGAGAGGIHPNATQPVA